ncbi:MAG: AAA family ATPase [Lachnospiraceae bacterium]|nr:AAA family ATPase [Lachnospiraceae bacterium]MCM1233734.1 AAA family ATPase [Ruminococcus flavefaciens]
MGISKIVITGGPCAGKSTAMSWISNAFAQRGYKVIFVPETATELITGGVTPWECASNQEYQVCQMRLQMEKERIFEQGADSMRQEKILIVCDRGTMDNQAYMTEAEFEAVLSELGADEVHLRENYDAVFHLVTAAKGAEQFYTLANNQARTETPQQAREMDDKLIAAWAGHPHLRIIDNSTDFEGKMKRLIAEISAFLGEPEPYEIERKFLIEYPDTAWLQGIPNCRRVEIIQTYLSVEPDYEVRIRQRGLNGNYMYYETTKKKINGLKRIELERRLSEREYLRLLMEADTNRRQIRKTRYCMVYENQYFEIDLYPFWNDQAIVEIELREEDQQIRMPKELKVIREVTGEAAYKNAALAVRERREAI